MALTLTGEVKTSFALPPFFPLLASQTSHQAAHAKPASLGGIAMKRHGTADVFVRTAVPTFLAVAAGVRRHVASLPDRANQFPEANPRQSAAIGCIRRSGAGWPQKFAVSGRSAATGIFSTLRLVWSAVLAYYGPDHGGLGPDLAPGEVAEWLNAPHSKCGIGASLSGVRIPPSPPRNFHKILTLL
jgi:hypothetical protein